MRVLLVHSGNAVAGLSSTYTFVHEQGEALRARGIEIEYYAVVGKGTCGYLKNVRPLRKKIKDFQPDIIHAHYGLSGMLAVLSTRRPVVITCHNDETRQFLQFDRAPVGEPYDIRGATYTRHALFQAAELYDIAVRY